MAWGSNDHGQATVPAGLSGVSAVSADWAHTLALKTDGTVVAWGNNDHGQSTVPSGLTGVTAVNPGHWQSLVLKADGTVVAWGLNTSGQTVIPAGLNGVGAIDAGGDHNLALIPPVLAANDSYSTAENTALTVNAPGVLTNDTYVDGVTLSVSKVADPPMAPSRSTPTVRSRTHRPPATAVPTASPTSSTTAPSVPTWPRCRSL